MEPSTLFLSPETARDAAPATLRKEIDETVCSYLRCLEDCKTPEFFTLP